MFGWMHYSYSKHKYVQVRATGVETGGTHEVTLNYEDDYQKVLQIAIDLFFPKGKSVKGKLTSMDVAIGTIKGERIPGFSIHNIFSASGKQKFRLYLLSKMKMLVLTDSSYDENFLPEPSILRGALSYSQEVNMAGPSRATQLRNPQMETTATATVSHPERTTNPTQSFLPDFHTGSPMAC